MGKSKVAKIKEEMMWQKFGPMCGNCRWFTSTMVTTENDFNKNGWVEEKAKRCATGSFATRKSYWCPGHEFK